MDKREFLSSLHEGRFQQLFIDCFWDNPTTTKPIALACGVEGTDLVLSFHEVAQKKGYRIYVCRTATLPDSAMRRFVDAKLRKLSHDYLAIYVSTAEPFHHLWSVPVKTVDRRQLVTIEYVQDDQAAFLVGKMSALTFSLASDPSIVDVVDTVNAAFLVNAADVTKKFYQGFRKQHDAFVKGIQHLGAAGDREWYASVMLNRLMFCYFIQKKRFLDFNENYLGDKLKETQAKKGQDKFYGSFYRSFLKELFSDGLDKPVAGRSRQFLAKYGRIPYLNGGMFSMHQIEKENKDIDIPDKVFENLFAFFDQWCWHLDNRITASGRDINPDVLGYIFEQYINDRAQMGAYYTKEDITEYIGRNCIVPYLFEKVLGGTRSVASANWIWQFLRNSGDAYIFPAVRKGVDLPLPDYIEQGVNTAKPGLRERRARWNEKTDAAYALPTEIWRETVARRQRCTEIRGKISSGAITDIHDFITYNLDIRAFAEDVIRKTDDHKFVLHFYKVLREVTILDPTCGSGAFLFAALNILEPLYEACLDRMEEWHAANKNLFKDELEEIAGKFRSNRQYFIYKNIILRNLYGVDIMHEATEIARLRLFLKMVAVVDVDEYDPNLGLDPLPDIDFNIRCGNTLVGYATEKEIEAGLVNGDMFAYAELKQKIDTELTKVSMAYDFFRREQLNLAGDHQQLVKAKGEINRRLAIIRTLLDDQLYDRHSGKKKPQWLADTQPFHWYTEFYPIMHGRGGFDVIIGNPPYVETSKVKGYAISGYKTIECGNLYAHVIERTLRILIPEGGFGMIIPSASVCTPRMNKLQELICEASLGTWISLWDERPSKLFDGVDQQLSIQIAHKGKAAHDGVFITAMRHWDATSRCYIFNDVNYGFSSVLNSFAEVFPKGASSLEVGIVQSLAKVGIPLATFKKDSGTKVYYRNAGGRYWRLVKSFPSFFKSEAGAKSTSTEKTFFASKDHVLGIVAVLSSSLFYWFWRLYSNCRHLTERELLVFPVPNFTVHKELTNALSRLAGNFEDRLNTTKDRVTTNNQRSGKVIQDFYHVSSAKPIIDKIDELLAKHYGFTEEELDFIINYDIKYRMGGELNAE